jgi:hypothetical protein
MLVNFNRVSTSTRRLAFDLPTFCALLSNVGGMIDMHWTYRAYVTKYSGKGKTHTHTCSTPANTQLLLMHAPDLVKIRRPSDHHAKILVAK